MNHRSVVSSLRKILPDPGLEPTSLAELDSLAGEEDADARAAYGLLLQSPELPRNLRERIGYAHPSGRWFRATPIHLSDD